MRFHREPDKPFHHLRDRAGPAGDPGLRGDAMIPASSVAFQDDGTAWLYVPDHGIRTDVTDSRRYMSDFDHPCDTCGGTLHYVDDRGEVYEDSCPADCINGRHTFTIDVERAGLACSVCGLSHLSAGAMPDGDHAWTPPVRSLRVSVKPGMVLPIVDQEDGCPDTPHVCVFHGRMGGEPHNQWTLFGADGVEDELDPFPSDAKPGGWAVQLRTEPT